jgi:hypothetical protein
MRIRFVPCASVALCLCLILALPAFAQTFGSGGFGPCGWRFTKMADFGPVFVERGVSVTRM